MFYRLDSTRITLREYWWGTKNPFALLLAVVLKLLRVRIPGSSDDPNVEALTPFEVSADQIPAEIRERFQPLTGELTTLGFGFPLYHSIYDRVHQTRIYWASFAHASGKAWARIHHRIWTQPQPPRVYLFPMFLTALADGQFLVSSSAGKLDMLPAPRCRVLHRRNAASAKLWAEHQSETEREELRTSVKPVRSLEELRQAIEAHHAVTRDFHVARGVFAPMTSEEQQHNLASPPVTGDEHAEILTEMAALQTQKPSWGNALVILVVSALIFLGAGSAQWSWELALGMIPILLFHELGHFLAMRMFNYQNVRMFFIPFFGAAVTGRNYNIPGWKKAIVSLMGPVPGIALGIGIGIAGLLLHQPLMMKAAFLTLVLNAFNLLPILPLDGGWVLHATLFCRHPLLDAGFRVLAAIGLFALGVFMQAKVLPYLAIPMLISLPTAYRTARVAATVRRNGLPEVSDDTQAVPPATAGLIIGEVKRAFPKHQNTRLLAQLSLNVFELANARPPHWAATLGLLFVHGASMALAVVFGVLFVIGRDGNLKEGLAAARMGQSAKLLTLDTVKTTAGAGFSAVGEHVTVVVTLKTPSETAAAFDVWSNRLPDAASLTRFGQSLVLSLPAADKVARKHWVKDAERLNTNAFVCTTNYAATLTLSCLAPDEPKAVEIRREAQHYFRPPATLWLIPPWAATDARTPKERTTHARSRASYYQLREPMVGIATNAVMLGISERLIRARKQGDEAAVKDLEAQARQQYSESANKVLGAATAFGAHPPEVVEYFRQVSAIIVRTSHAGKRTPEEVAAVKAERAMHLAAMAPSLGALPAGTDASNSSLARETARMGVVTGKDGMIVFHGVQLASPAETARAIHAWLLKQGCQSFKYQLSFAGSSLREPGE
ncbi:MAG: site-2 protease family protein [Limisphaerales bacterium]